MSKSIQIRSNTYPDVPEINVPIPQASGGGTAKFMETSDATATAQKVRNGETFYAQGEKKTGSMTEKAAATYTPTTSDQTIAADQYLAGAQTIKGDPNLIGANIVSGVEIFNVQGSAEIPVITQNSTTKILSIS